jgi:hypothetical protein
MFTLLSPSVVHWQEGGTYEIVNSIGLLVRGSHYHLHSLNMLVYLPSLVGMNKYT